MSFAALLAFIEANGATILGIWLLLEQLLAANTKIKANSTFQLVSNVVKVLLGKKTAS
jgi:hypothetical protein